MKIPTLKTERLILRPLGEKYIDAVQEYFDEWDIVKFTHGPWPYPEGEAKRHFHESLSPKMLSGKQIAWAITLPSVEKHSGFIGRIDYRIDDNAVWDRGFWLALPFQGNGYMTDAVIATQDYMFFEYGLDKFIVKNTISNIASRRIKEKTGATYIREDSKPCSPHIDEPVDVWEVTRENWAKIRGRKL